MTSWLTPKLCQMEMEGRVWLECRPSHSLLSQYRNDPELHARKIWFQSLLWLTLRDVIQSFILNDTDIALPLDDLNRRINWYNAMAYNSATLCKCYVECLQQRSYIVIAKCITTYAIVIKYFDMRRTFTAHLMKPEMEFMAQGVSLKIYMT